MIEESRLGIKLSALPFSCNLDEHLGMIFVTIKVIKKASAKNGAQALDSDSKLADFFFKAITTRSELSAPRRHMRFKA